MLLGCVSNPTEKDAVMGSYVTVGWAVLREWEDAIPEAVWEATSRKVVMSARTEWKVWLHRAYH